MIIALFYFLCIDLGHLDTGLFIASVIFRQASPVLMLEHLIFTVDC